MTCANAFRLSTVILLVAAAMLTAVAGTSVAALVQWTIASGGNDHWYEFIHSPAGFTWEQASAAASASSHLGLPGYLATVTSQGENDFLYALAKYPPGTNGTIFDPANPAVSLGPIDISGRDGQPVDAGRYRGGRPQRLQWK